MNIGTRSRFFPFTASQWQELEQQALIYKYIVSGIPIPPDLLFSIKRSFISDPSLSSKLFPRHPPHMGWRLHEMGVGRKVDPEPGRCRRTDGKKWRCSKEAYPDSKYCERHMHRGKNRSRKPVEFTTNATNSALILPSVDSQTSASTPLGVSQSAHDFSTAHLFLDSSASHFTAETNYRTRRYMDEHAFLEPSRSVRGFSSSSLDEDPWHLAPLTINTRSSHTSKQRNSYSVSDGDFSSYLQLHSVGDHRIQKHQRTDQQCYIMGTEMVEQREEEKTNMMRVHKFFDEWPLTNRESSRNTSSVPMTELSVSVPASSYEFPVFDSISQKGG